MLWRVCTQSDPPHDHFFASLAPQTAFPSSVINTQAVSQSGRQSQFPRVLSSTPEIVDAASRLLAANPSAAVPRLFLLRFSLSLSLTRSSSSPAGLSPDQSVSRDDDCQQHMAPAACDEDNCTMQVQQRAAFSPERDQQQTRRRRDGPPLVALQSENPHALENRADGMARKTREPSARHRMQQPTATNNQQQMNDGSGAGGVKASPLSSSSSSSSASSSSSSSPSKSYARYIQIAKRNNTDLRASIGSTASTSSNSTRTSNASSIRNSRSNHSQPQHDDAHRRIKSSLARHESTSRRRARREMADDRARALVEQQQLMEQDPDYLPIDSTHYKRQVTQTKKKRARRIKLKHYGLAKQAAKLNNLSGFLLHSITPRESSILTYTSMASPGTHTEYDIVVENFRTGMIWQVSRRYSTFRLLRDELVKPFLAPHCHYCASIMRDIQKLEVHFPGKRLWGSTSPSVVRGRAERFQKYLHGLMDIATSGYKLNCRLIANYFVVQLRNFLTSESVRYKGIPGEYGQQIPSMLRELSTPRSPHDQMTLQTIQEHSSRSSRGSLFEDLEGFDEKDFREKLRLAEEHDRHYMMTIAREDISNNNGDGNSSLHGFTEYFREEDEDEFGDDDIYEDVEVDDDDDDEDEQKQQKRHSGRQRRA